ncbi:KAP family P-loop NTPase fold protein [Psychroserpens sp. MEBiC05023]
MAVELKFDYPQYQNLIKVVLEKEYSINLISNYRPDRGSIKFVDFADPEKLYFIDVFSENSETNFNDVDENFENIEQKFQFLINKFKGQEITYIAVFYDNIARTFRKSFLSKYNNVSSTKYILINVFDKNDILDMANRYRIDLRPYYEPVKEKTANRLEFEPLQSDTNTSIEQSAIKGQKSESASYESAIENMFTEPQKKGFNDLFSKRKPERPKAKPEPKKEPVNSDKIPFHLDLVEDVDRLNREPIAKSLTRLLNNQIFKTKINKEDQEKSNVAFMVHLQGAWGDGKSTFLNLIEKNLNSKSNSWKVIHFNAWQNQHISPPWWPFLDQIYRQSICSFPLHKKPYLWGKERMRRLIKYRGFSRVIIIFLVILFSICVLLFQTEIFNFLMRLGLFSDSKNNASLKTIFDTIVAISSVIGLFYTLASFISKPFFISSPEAAKTFLEKAADPMQKVKKHFQSLISDIEACGFKTAVFIDDLDRCNDKFTVELLEGIQTLFRDKQVLYVVAGDKHWISTCFENHYKNYNDVVKEPTQKLGYLFLEKAFQLSLRLPNISGDIKKSYWEYILQVNAKENHSEKHIDRERRQEIIDDIQRDYKTDDYTSPSVVQGFKKKYNLKDGEATDITLEILDMDNKDVNHILQAHFDLLDTNPRGIKRLANQYNIYRNTLVAERKSFSRDKLFRWIILQNKYPVFTDWVEHNLHLISGDIIDEAQWKKDMINDLLWKTLVQDENNLKGGTLTTEDVRTFTGQQN